MMKDVKDISADAQNTRSNRAFQITGGSPIGTKILGRLRTIRSRKKVGQDRAADFMAMHTSGSEPLGIPKTRGKT
jgi:hypothetical protein